MFNKKSLITGLATMALAGGMVVAGVAVKADSDLTAQAANSAKISLIKASELALAEAKSGKVIDVNLDQEGTNLVYDVTVVDDTTEKDFTVNAETGAVEKVKEEKLTAKDKEEKELAKATPKVSLADLESKLSQKYSGFKLVDAELDYKKSTLVYKVELISDTEEVDARVDANTGEVIKEKTEKLDTK